MNHDTLTQENDFFGKEKISRILLQIAPPVMLAQLIQALYNIVDSFFVGRYSANALTALSVIYPLQLIIVALAVGTGVGLNTYMARKYAQQAPEAADAAVTVLGLYYKLQTFFFIPLLGLQTCIVPVISYNYARAAYRRCRDTVRCSVVFSLAVMAVGAAAFILIPGTLIRVFSRDAEVLSIGCHAFPIIGVSFLPAVVSLMMPVFFQAIGYGRTSLSLSLLRQIVCLLPLFYLLARFGLGYTWFAFPLAELISGGTGLVLYLRVVKQWQAAVS